jgi:hypothetical protein
MMMLAITIEIGIATGVRSLSQRNSQTAPQADAMIRPCKRIDFRTSASLLTAMRLVSAIKAANTYATHETAFNYHTPKVLFARNIRAMLS